MKKKNYLGLAVIKDKQQNLQFYILNSTPYRVLILCYLDQSDGLEALYTGALNPKNYSPISFSFDPQVKYKFRIAYIYISSKTKSFPSLSKTGFIFFIQKVKASNLHLASS